MKTVIAVLALTLAAPALADGVMTCSAPRATWQPESKLAASLTKDGWKIRKMQVDGGCYEVYGTTPEGDRVEAYFDPATLEKLYVGRRGEVLFRKQ